MLTNRLPQTVALFNPCSSFFLMLLTCTNYPLSWGQLKPVFFQKTELSPEQCSEVMRIASWASMIPTRLMILTIQKGIYVPTCDYSQRSDMVLHKHWNKRWKNKWQNSDVKCKAKKRNCKTKSVSIFVLSCLTNR
jgi:hypothetical protein